jgi:hypothetical protein
MQLSRWIRFFVISRQVVYYPRLLCNCTSFFHSPMQFLVCMSMWLLSDSLYSLICFVAVIFFYPSWSGCVSARMCACVCVCVWVASLKERMRFAVRQNSCTCEHYVVLYAPCTVDRPRWDSCTVGFSVWWTDVDEAPVACLIQFGI